jgi:adenylate kinase
VALDILMLGPQGAGKGTQAKRLSDAYGIPHIATGDMLRSAIAAGTDVGREVKDVVESGRLVPDELMISLIRERLSEPDTEPGFILDGFPRTTVQAEALDVMFNDIGRAFTVVFELQLRDEAAIQRLLRRAQLEGRADDTPDAIRRRLELYHRETEPLVEYYRARGNLVGIPGDRSEGEVFEDLQRVLEQLPAGDPA